MVFVLTVVREMKIADFDRQINQGTPESGTETKALKSHNQLANEKRRRILAGWDPSCSSAGTIHLSYPFLIVTAPDEASPQSSNQFNPFPSFSPRLSLLPNMSLVISSKDASFPSSLPLYSYPKSCR